MQNAWYARLIVAGLAFAVCATSHGQVMSQVTSPKVVDLTPDACAVVSAGDVLSFAWNPAFDSAGEVTGVRAFSLQFIRSENVFRAGRLGPSFTLEANPRQHGQLPNQIGTEITATANGYYLFRFQFNRRFVEPGEYTLIGASADALTSAGFTGQPPQMTNSPLRYKFCIDVVAATRGRK